MKEQRVYQQIQDTKNEINYLLLSEMEKRCVFLKQSYYEMGPRSTKLLAKCRRKQQANTVYKIRDLGTNKVTYDPEDTERVLQRFYEKLYTQPLAADEKEMATF